LVEWGWLNPGEQVTRTLYVFNDGNVPVTLTAVAQNWQPMESPSYLNFTWDKEGALLDAAHGIPVVLTLTVALDIANTTISDFSFEVLMTGTQT
jgi:hypothetical protein